MNNYFVFKPSNPNGGGVADPHLVASYHSPSVVANAAVMCPTNGGGLISSNPSTTHSSTSSLISSASSSRQSIGPFIDYAPNSYLNQNSAYLHPTQQLQQYDIFVTFNRLLLRFDFKNLIFTLKSYVQPFMSLQQPSNSPQQQQQSQPTCPLSPAQQHMQAAAAVAAAAAAAEKKKKTTLFRKLSEKRAHKYEFMQQQQLQQQLQQQQQHYHPTNMVRQHSSSSSSSSSSLNNSFSNTMTSKSGATVSLPIGANLSPRMSIKSATSPLTTPPNTPLSISTKGNSLIFIYVISLRLSSILK